MKWLINAFVALAVFPTLLFGCVGGAVVRKDRLDQTGRVAIVSVVIPRIADTAKESNRIVLQAAAERALARVEADLKSAGHWTVVDPSGYRGSTPILSLSVAADQEVAALITQGGDRKNVREIVQELSHWKGAYIGAKGLPVVPRSGVVTTKGDKSALGLIPQLIGKHAARLCRELNVDAVAFVHILASVTHPRPKTFIISNNRTDGILSVAQTMVIVDKNGQVIADMGRPKLDGRARSRDLLPLYAGSGQSAVRQENIDLGDPGKNIFQAFSLLVEETAADMVLNFKKAAAK